MKRYVKDLFTVQSKALFHIKKYIIHIIVAATNFHGSLPKYVKFK